VHPFNLFLNIPSLQYRLGLIPEKNGDWVSYGEDNIKVEEIKP